MTALTPEMIDAMVAAGLTRDQMAALMKASLAAAEKKATEKRAKDAERQRKSRERRGLSRGVTVTPSDTADIADVTKIEPPTESNPSTPQQEPSKREPPKGVSPKGSRSDDFPADAFGRWYSLYPKHVAKADAERAFAKVRRSGQVTFAALMAGTERFIRTKPPDPQFIPHPATWLNRGQWTDEPAPQSLNSPDLFNGRCAPGARNGGVHAFTAGVAATLVRRGLAGSGRGVGVQQDADDPGIVDADYGDAASH